VASSSHLKPGEEGKIVATVDIKGKIGFITKAVKVFTNDPKRPAVPLVLKALIKAQPSSPQRPTSPQQPTAPEQPASPAQPPAL
jgi:hypothetical protein